MPEVRRTNALPRKHLQQHNGEGLLAGLRAAVGLGIGKVIVKGDSQLVIKQVNKEYDCQKMAPYVEEVWKLSGTSVASELLTCSGRRTDLRTSYHRGHPGENQYLPGSTSRCSSDLQSLQIGRAHV